ncbi:TetR/AcrR family transcriptional regulator [Mycobacterium europaeum]|uniref:Transcriptional regulator n=1 Tax=Mycobacterium europaeum TaxID=761804 RepID=A0A0U1D247_9MYCO|nr:TetR/AcrR family transcriptional regulator [Mycobacterium europaeum]MEA1157833.1 TetR/AcrR family transcriptional regulator [Mycobacterium europaeum]ORV51727.1 transcriptional regulator [Mycobacterium europaeum]CQD06624.1 transcriptional regulator [Mycobacterium europaeum]
MPVDAVKPVPTALLTAATDTLRHLGPRRFSLTAVAEAAGVSRGTVHNLLGTRDNAIAAALNELASGFIATMAVEVAKEGTLADQAAAVAVLICAHRQRSLSTSRGINQSILVLLLEHGGDELMRRSIELWKPLVKAAQRSGEVGADIDPVRASEWIVRMLFSFELIPPISVNLDNPRAVRRFVSDHMITGLIGAQRA